VGVLCMFWIVANRGLEIGEKGGEAPVGGGGRGGGGGDWG